MRNQTQTYSENSNPTEADISDRERAEYLKEWLSSYEQAGIRPKLMPLGDEGKAPIAKNKFRVFDNDDDPTEQANKAVVSGDEAVRRIQNGENGFVCYAGRPEWGTEGIVFADHDDPERYPYPTGEPTLTVATRRGTHEHYLNDPNDPVSNAKVGDGEGEIRAHNQYVLVPGSIHPSGVVYQIENNYPIQTLSDTQLDDKHRPVVASNPDTPPIETDVEVDEEYELDIERLGETINSLGIDTPVKNPGIRLKRALRSKKGNRIQALWTGHYDDAGHPNDRSKAECALASYLGFWFEGNWGTVSTLMDVSCSQHPTTDNGDPRKWANREDGYRASLKPYATQGPTKNMRGPLRLNNEERPDSSSVLRRSVRNVTKALGLATRQEIMDYDADEASQWDEVDRKERSVRNALSWLEDEGLIFWYRSGRHTYYYTTPGRISKEKLEENDVDREDIIQQFHDRVTS